MNGVYFTRIIAGHTRINNINAINVKNVEGSWEVVWRPEVSLVILKPQDAS